MMFKSWFYSGANRSDLYPRSIPQLSGRLKYSTEIAEVKGKSVLVVGDSYGWYADYALNSRAKLVHSLDIAPASPAIHALKKKFSNFKHFQASILDFSSAVTYDICAFFEVIEHLPPSTEQKALKMIHNLLSSSGMLLLSTPFSSLLSYISDPACILGHRHYTRNRLYSLLSRVGFEDIMFTRGGYIFSAIDLLSLYFTKWILHRPYTSFLVPYINSEYPHPGGTTIFAICRKS